MMVRITQFSAQIEASSDGHPATHHSVESETSLLTGHQHIRLFDAFDGEKDLMKE